MLRAECAAAAGARVTGSWRGVRVFKDRSGRACHRSVRSGRTGLTNRGAASTTPEYRRPCARRHAARRAVQACSRCRPAECSASLHSTSGTANGYLVEVFSAGKRLGLPLREFTLDDGTRFNPMATKLLQPIKPITSIRGKLKGETEVDGESYLDYYNEQIHGRRPGRLDHAP